MPSSVRRSRAVRKNSRVYRFARPAIQGLLGSEMIAS